MKEKLKLTRSKRDKNVWACSNIFSIDFLLFLHSLGLCCAQPQRWRRRGCGRGERKWHNQRRQKNTVIIMIEKKQCERHLSDSVAFRCCLNLSFTWQYMWTPSGSYESGIKMKLCLTFLQSSLNRRSPISICLVMFKEHKDSSTGDVLCSAESCTLEVRKPYSETALTITWSFSSAESKQKCLCFVTLKSQ